MLNCKKLIHSIIHTPKQYTLVTSNQHSETIREVIFKARDLDTIAMSLLLQEGYSSVEVKSFTDALYYTIESVQKS